MKRGYSQAAVEEQLRWWLQEELLQVSAVILAAHAEILRPSQVQQSQQDFKKACIQGLQCCDCVSSHLEDRHQDLVLPANTIGAALTVCRPYKE